MNLALFEAVTVLASLLKEFDFEFAPDYLDRAQLADAGLTPRYSASLTLPMVSATCVVDRTNRD